MNNYIKILLFIITICNGYSATDNEDKAIEEYYGITFQEFNNKLIYKLENINFIIEYITKNIDGQIKDIFENTNPNNITKVFQESLRNEYNKINQYLIQIKEQYNEKLNTDNKLDISNILIQYHSCINNIKQLFIEYIRQSNNNSYFAMIISYIQSYWKKMSYDKKLLQELLNFLQKRVDNKFFEYTWDEFYSEYKKYYKPISNLNDWEII